MKFYISNPELDSKIAEIRRTIRLSMNGIVSDQMKNSGIIYKRNYGVSIPRIKEIAKVYSPNHDLAQRLWLLQIRETMIMATLLEPIDKFSPELAQSWVESFNQIEIIEQSCMNLFCKLPFANKLVADWIQSNELWIQITGYILAARLVDKLSNSEIIEIVNKATESSATSELHLYKSLALCLSRFCRKDKEVATYILKETEAFSQNSSIGQQYIYNEVKQEMLFLGIS
ncbi:MAG TPA: DNA alkylation repair protein [Paludibacter sp.]